MCFVEQLIVIVVVVVQLVEWLDEWLERLVRVVGLVGRQVRGGRRDVLLLVPVLQQRLQPGGEHLQLRQVSSTEASGGCRSEKLVHGFDVPVLLIPAVWATGEVELPGAGH